MKPPEMYQLQRSDAHYLLGSRTRATVGLLDRYLSSRETSLSVVSAAEAVELRPVISPSVPTVEVAEIKGLEDHLGPDILLVSPLTSIYLHQVLSNFR